jgi:two-component system, lytT family, response regulator lytT
MIKIAVVDDDELICKEIVEIIRKFNVFYEFDFRPEYYCSCEEVYNSIVSGCNYDLIFLDIEFSGMNGTEFGKILRMKLKNYETQIIFISAVKDYAMELFKIRPIEFLVKPITEETLKSCLLTYMTHFENSNGFLEYTLENTKHRIRIREVLYLESNKKKTEFHTRSSNFSVYGKVTDIIGDNKNKFVCISRGIYVNVQHIIEATTKEVYLTDNSKLYISRGCQDAVRDRLSEI